MVTCLIEYRAILKSWLKDHLRPRYNEVFSEFSENLPIHIWGIFNHSITLLESNIKILNQLIEKYQQSIIKKQTES